MSNYLQIVEKTLSNKSPTLFLKFMKYFSAKCQHLDTSNIHHDGSSRVTYVPFIKGTGVVRLDGDSLPFRIVSMYVVHIVSGLDV